MANVKPERGSASKPKAQPKAKNANSKPTGVTPRRRHPLARRRALVATLLGVVAALALGGGAIWRLVAPLVAGRERYLLKADSITISELPEWIVGDVRRQVVERAGIAGRLSILDPNFLTTIQDAFALHPWVERVVRIEKKFPPAVFVELQYRRPVAVVEAPQGNRSQLLPIDARGIHLPSEDVPLIRRTYLPRLTGIVGQPPVGQAWDDARVAGGVELAIRLAEHWDALELTSIVPSARPEVLGDQKYFVYDLVNRGGTRIEWGAAPQTQLPGEADFTTKLGWLEQCVRQYAPLEWVDWPEKINVRRGIEITPRTAKKSRKPADEPVVAEKPDEAGGEDDAVVK